MAGPGRGRGALIALGLAWAMAGCAIGPLRQPPNTVALSFYMRDLSGETHSYRIIGEHPDPAPFTGHVVAEPASTGCAFVGTDWELVVAEGDPPPQPGEDLVAHVTADDFGNRDPVAISLSIHEDGTAIVEEGVPDWWQSDLQVCP